MGSNVSTATGAVAVDDQGCDLFEWRSVTPAFSLRFMPGWPALAENRSGTRAQSQVGHTSSLAPRTGIGRTAAQPAHLPSQGSTPIWARMVSNTM